MSGQMYGADVEELQRVAQEFRRAADEIDSQGNALTGTVNRISWLGDIASSFIGDWTGVSLPKIGASTEFLRSAAARLDKNAQEQRMASATGGAGAWKVSLTKEQKKQLAPLVDAANKAARMTPEEQAAWWDSLSDYEKHLLQVGAPGVLMDMPGLPPEVRQRAHDDYLADLAAKVVVSTQTYTYGRKVAIPDTPFKVGTEVSATKSTRADGTVDVEVTQTESGSVEAKDVVEGTVAVAGSQTLHFDTQQEADNFLRGLAAATALGPLHVKAYMLLHSAKMTSASLGAETSGKAGPVEASQGGTVSVSTDGSVTVSATAKVSGTAPNLGVTDLAVAEGGTGVAIGAKGNASVSATTSLTVGSDGKPQSITVSTTTEGGVDVGASGTVTATGGAGAGTTVSVELDLNDPVFAGHVDEIVAAAKRGDPAAVIAAVNKVDPQMVYDRSTVTTTTYSTTSVNGGVDAKVVEVNGSYSTTQTQSTTIKVPGGKPVKVP